MTSLLLAVLMQSAHPSSSRAAHREAHPVTLQKAIDRILDRPAFAAAFWGAEVRDLRSGDVLYARHAGKSLTPASTMKLVTTAAALDVLGPEARFRTTLETAAPLEASGRLSGDLYLVGRGDTGLAERAPDGRTGFDELVSALSAAGVRRIEGRLVGHEGLFKGDRRGASWGWDDLVWCYGAEVSALSWNDGCADLTVSPGTRPGEPAVVTRRPVSAYYDVRSSAATSAAGSKSDLTLVRDLGSNLVLLSGTYPAGAGPEELAVALENPARYAATVFAEALAAAGITLTGPVATSSEPLPSDLRVLGAHESPPLAEILKKTNKRSDNLRAETLLRLVGGQARAEASASAGGAAVAEFLGRVGVSAEAASLDDGSGMAPTDLLAPHQIVDLLAAMDRHPQAQVFRDSLAVAGVDGTLEHRMRGTKAMGRVLAKTGTRRHVNAMAGYVNALSGERLAFSIVVNNHTASPREATAAIDEVCLLLVGGR
jgi:D-alanyl-D-alanine carboxypeptidase/D-alanyl-D-alanine-endopeptidase (penicillin-binding protein 4)